MSTALGRLIPNSADLFELAPLDAYEDEALTSAATGNVWGGSRPPLGGAGLF